MLVINNIKKGDMKDHKLHLGHSSLTGRIYLGKQNDDRWVGEKRDVTNEFLQVMEHKFPVNTAQNVSINGENSYRVIVVDMDRKVLIDGKEVELNKNQEK